MCSSIIKSIAKFRDRFSDQFCGQNVFFFSIKTDLYNNLFHILTQHRSLNQSLIANLVTDLCNKPFHIFTQNQALNLHLVINLEDKGYILL